MEWQHLHSLDISESRSKFSNLQNVIAIISETRHQHEAHPNRPFLSRQALCEFSSRSRIHACQVLMLFRAPYFHPKQHEVDFLEVLVGQAVTIKPIGLDRGVYAHLLGGSEKLEHEAMLHQWFA